MGFYEIDKKNLEEALKIGYLCFDDPLDQQGLANGYAHYVNGPRNFYCDITNHQIFLLNYMVWYNECGQPVGIAGIYQYTDMSDGRDLVWLGWFGTSPSQRRKGVATQMIKDVVVVAKEIYANAVVILFTESNNDGARAFYESVGFLAVGECVFSGDDRPKTIYELYDTE